MGHKNKLSGKSGLPVLFLWDTKKLCILSHTKKLASWQCWFKNETYYKTKDKRILSPRNWMNRIIYQNIYFVWLLTVCIIFKWNGFLYDNETKNAKFRELSLLVISLVNGTQTGANYKTAITIMKCKIIIFDYYQFENNWNWWDMLGIRHMLCMTWWSMS